MKLWSLRSAYNNYEIIVVTASLGVTRRRSLCRHVLLTAVWLNTTIGGSNTPSHAAVRHLWLVTLYVFPRMRFEMLHVYGHVNT